MESETVLVKYPLKMSAEVDRHDKEAQLSFFQRPTSVFFFHEQHSTQTTREQITV